MEAVLHSCTPPRLSLIVSQSVSHPYSVCSYVLSCLVADVYGFCVWLNVEGNAGRKQR